MQTRRGHGRADGSAPDSRIDRGEAVTSGTSATSGPDGVDGAATWAPAEQGGRLVSLDEDEFAALVRPLRDAHDAHDARNAHNSRHASDAHNAHDARDARRRPPPADAE